MENLDLRSAQNADGGWPFRSRVSCTEPTALAALALGATGEARENYQRAIDWLRSLQRSDGGWPPMPGIAQSTWVTSLVLLLPPGDLGEQRYRRGVDWLVRQQGEETSFYYRLGQRLHGRAPAAEDLHAGWPWFPGAAAWVSPTATAILALRRLRQLPAPRQRIAEGRQFLLDHMCADGGWNHGSVRAQGVESPSYPETTGLALLALQGLAPGALDRSIQTALRHLNDCHSAEASAWLRLGLEAQGVSIPASAAKENTETQSHDPRDAALQLLAESASQGRNPLL